jgi:hypothetical protein
MAVWFSMVSIVVNIICKLEENVTQNCPVRYMDTYPALGEENDHWILVFLYVPAGHSKMQDSRCSSLELVLSLFTRISLGESTNTHTLHIYIHITHTRNNKVYTHTMHTTHTYSSQTHIHSIFH